MTADTSTKADEEMDDYDPMSEFLDAINAEADSRAEQIATLTADLSAARETIKALQADLSASETFYEEERTRAENLEGDFKGAREEIERLRGATVDTAGHLAAAISLLEHSPKKCAPSDTIFDMMLADYRASLERARQALSTAPGGEHDR